MRSSGKAVRSVLLAGALSVLVPTAGEARVVQFVVEHRESFAGGAAWGNAGPYERLFGTAFMEVDPRDPLNAGIVGLDKAPRNARGMVEFSTPFYIVKPVDGARQPQDLLHRQ